MSTKFQVEEFNENMKKALTIGEHDIYSIAIQESSLKIHEQFTTCIKNLFNNYNKTSDYISLASLSLPDNSNHLIIMVRTKHYWKITNTKGDIKTIYNIKSFNCIAISFTFNDTRMLIMNFNIFQITLKT